MTMTCSCVSGGKWMKMICGRVSGGKRMAMMCGRVSGGSLMGMMDYLLGEVLRASCMEHGA